VTAATDRVRVVAVAHSFPDLDAERAVLGPLGAELENGAGLSREDAVELTRGADAILLGAGVSVDAAWIAELEGCRAIVRYGVGVDNVDIEAAEARGIAVGRVPDYCVEEVSNHAIALLLALHRRLIEFDGAVRSGGWKQHLPRVERLSDCSLGVVGFGRIGREVARKGAALGLRSLAFDPLLPGEEIAAAGATPHSLGELLAGSDFVSLHLPLTPDTRHLIDAGALGAMKRGAVLINVSRGGLIDEDALAEALRAGHLGGAGLDTMENEPLRPDSRLLEAPGLILTPHVAWLSAGARRALQRGAAEEAARLLEL
jgi:D-3-phosphoglycerate dehydrogenase / 2-oxoglutarate reductase